MTLHHFRKEFQYLRLRWCAFLALLALDLAVNLEWVFAPQWGEQAPLWVQFIPIATALAALSMMEGCPEDRPGNERRFVGTRPLPQRSYWLAAVMASMVLIVVPAALQNGLYLLLSARPMADVLRGIGERACFIIGIGLWLLPMRALTLEREKWLTGGLALIIAIVGIFGLPLLLQLIDEDAPGFDLPPDSWIYATLTLAVALSLLAWLHQRRPLGPTVRIGTMALLIVGALVLCLYWPMRTAPLENRDPARVAELAPAFKPSIHLEEVGYYDWARTAESSGSFSLRSRIYPTAPGIHVALRSKGARVEQNGTVTDDRWKPWVSDSRFKENLRRVDTRLAAFFPAHTLFVQQPERQSNWAGVSDSTYRPFASLSPTVDREQAVNVQASFKADWWQREKLLDSPCVAGTTASTPDVSWTLVEGLAHQFMGKNNTLVSKRGAFSVRLRLHTRLHTRRHWDHGLETAFILHSPQRRLAWVGELETRHDVRGAGTGLERETLTLGWQNILNYADGEDAQVDPAQLRLVLISGRHLGESTWTWQMPPIVPRDHFSKTNQRQIPSMIHLGGDRNSCRERIASLKAPTAQSGEEEVRRYLYDVVMAIQSDWSGGSEMTKQDEEAALRPLFEHHLAYLLDVNVLMAGKDSVGERLLLKHLTEEHRDAVIQRLASSPHLIRVVLQRGWTEAARAYWHDRLMRSTHLYQDFIPLLIAWGDAALLDRIVTLMSYRIDSSHFDGVPHPPELMARLRPLADEQFRASTPFANAMAESTRTLKTAADFGNVTAMELCLRQLALDGYAARFNSPLPHLLDGQGKRIWMSYEAPETNTKLFRHRGVKNFEYVPEKLAWRVLP